MKIRKMIKRIYVKVALFFLASIVLSGHISAQSNEWENQHLTQINKEKPSATLFYDDSSDDVTSLNGIWTLHITTM